MSKIILTGDRPTGPLHLGHYVGSLKNRVTLQHEYTTFIIIADTQVMNNDVAKLKGIRQNIIEVVKDYLAVGINPVKSCIFLQSGINALFELTNYLSNFITVPRISRIPTIQAENALYNSSMSLGFLSYPVSQAADIALFDANLVPVGADQAPVIEFANEVLNRFNQQVGHSYFRKIQTELSDIPRLPGIDGKQKMSKSLNNAIKLNASDKEIKTAVNAMYTDCNHLKISDPGLVEGNVVFDFLNVFHDDKEELDELKRCYRKGGLGDGYLKSLLVTDIAEVIEPIRERRIAISNEYAMQVLADGTEKANKVAQCRMTEIREFLFGL